jgi:hypothetical protein
LTQRPGYRGSLGVPRLHFGGTDRQVGERLFVAQGTVETHVNSLMRKLGVATRSEAGAAYHWHLLPVLTRRAKRPGRGKKISHTGDVTA